MGLDKKQIDEMNVVFAEFKKSNDELQAEVKSYGEANGLLKSKVEKIQEKLDEFEIKAQRVNTAPGAGSHETKTAETEAVLDYMRTGDPTNFKALSMDNNPDGSYLISDQMATTIIERIRDFSPVRQVASKETISTGDTMLMPREGNNDYEAGWAGERQKREKTGTGDFEMIAIKVHEMYAQPAVTQSLVDDPAFDFESYINRRLAKLFNRKEGNAFISGNGVNQPEGLLISNQVAIVNGTLDFDSLIDMQAELRQEYAVNANFMFNRFTLADIRKLKDNNGQYLWQPSAQVGKPNTVLGDSYVIADDMPNASFAGSLVTGATPVLYGDFSAYCVVDKSGIGTLRDPFTEKPFVLFYTTKKVGGMVINDQAIKKLKLS